MTELEKFKADPWMWLQEWHDKNGEVRSGRLHGNAGYYVTLWVDDQDRPIATGVNKTLATAYESAIKSVDSLQALLG